jgi:hypothetical protein
MPDLTDARARLEEAADSYRVADSYGLGDDGANNDALESDLRALLSALSTADEALGITRAMYEGARADHHAAEAELSTAEAELVRVRENKRAAYIQGACAALTWMNCGMPMEDIEKAADDYARASLESSRG